MQRNGSVGCLTKQTITNAFDCILSCILFSAFIYIGLLVFAVIIKADLDHMFHVIGYISIGALITIPLGFYGSASGNIYALLWFFVLTSYLFYAISIYLWFNTRSLALYPTLQLAKDQASKWSSLKGFEILHQLICCSYTGLLVLALILATFKIISNVSQIEPTRVIVVDNNPSD